MMMRLKKFNKDCYYIGEELDLYDLMKPKCKKIDDHRRLLLEYAGIDTPVMQERSEFILSMLYFYEDYTFGQMQETHQAVIIGQFAKRMSGGIIDIIIFNNYLNHLNDSLWRYMVETKEMLGEKDEEPATSHYVTTSISLQIGCLKFTMMALNFYFKRCYCLCDKCLPLWIRNYATLFRYRLVIQRKYFPSRQKYLDVLYPLYIFDEKDGIIYLKKGVEPPTLFQIALKRVVKMKILPKSKSISEWFSIPVY